MLEDVTQLIVTTYKGREMYFVHTKLAITDYGLELFNKDTLELEYMIPRNQIKKMVIVVKEDESNG
ncbi:TPA: hypothetical protein IXN57_000474 [Enterococcus faecium]|uniref:hypothetical protein n=1 Tax=Enterococcus faecium TaxID=1352 RepID=UPI0003309D76|nr:hypothetical protein [Enterococcus faecium]EOH45693.1 hypothetical protein SSI_01733 [Enterococcus faecium EnGen0191]HAQ3640983.1 hypothetical protein [Enterococcus faecium]HCU0014017.1 hypothetical protein [Enterococcus faecium]